ncbi:MAG: flotillin family protein [Lentisphaerae bacterium]|nr:flotillin family protein [Lentisphaerota bacterium]
MSEMLLTSLWMIGQVQPDGNPAPFLVFFLLLFLIVMLMTFVRRYKRCPANKILVIYGKTGSGAAKCIHGGAKFVWPLLQAYDFLDLEPFVVPIDLSNALSQENIRVSVPTSVTAAISNQPGIMENAAVRLLGLTTQQIQTQAQDIIIGQMRAVIATMRIEDINRDRQAFMSKVNEAVAVELEKIGLSLINVNIRDLDDESGYIKAIGRKAAAEAVNQANVDVAEQEKTGQTGVAERQRDQRVAVAAATADAQIGEWEAEKRRRQQVAAAQAQAEIGEAAADREKRQNIARLDAEAVHAETDANAQKARFRADQKVAEEESRNKGDSASREADGAIRVAQETAEKKAEDARAIREQSRLNAEIVVPAEAQRKKIVIGAEAEKQQAVLVAQGQADAMLARMTAEGRGVQAVLDGKAQGYRNLVASAGDPQVATSLLIIEKLLEISHVQAQAIQNLPLEKIVVWDGGGTGAGGVAELGRRIMGVLPPMHELARQVGLDLPEFLGKINAAAKAEAAKTPPESDTGAKS